MNVKHLIIGGLLILTAGMHLKGQSDTTLSLSLVEAQNYAIENFFVSKNAELDIEAAKKKILETTAIGLPQVSVSADYQHIPNPPKIDFPAGPGPDDVISFEIAPEHNTTYGGTVSQLIFSGEYIVGLQAARVYRTYSEENYDKIKIDMRETVASSYYAILVLEANKETLVKTLDNLSSSLDQVRKTFATGLIEDTEVDQLNLTVKRTENQLSNINNQIFYLKNLFKYQLGLSTEARITFTNSLEQLISNNIESDSVYNFVLEDNIDYKLLSTNEKLQKLSLNREKTAFLPTISGFYKYSDQTYATDFSPTINHVVGLSASWDLFQSGKRYAKVSQAKIALIQAQNMKEQEAQRLELAAQQVKNDYQTALRKYYNDELNFKLSEKVLDKTTEKYKQGMVSSLELTTVNTQFLSAQMSFSTSIQELLTAKIALDKAHNKL